MNPQENMSVSTPFSIHAISGPTRKFGSSIVTSKTFILDNMKAVSVTYILPLLDDKDMSLLTKAIEEDNIRNEN